MCNLPHREWTSDQSSQNVMEKLYSIVLLTAFVLSTFLLGNSAVETLWSARPVDCDSEVPTFLRPNSTGCLKIGMEVGGVELDDSVVRSLSLLGEYPTVHIFSGTSIEPQSLNHTWYESYVPGSANSWTYPIVTGVAGQSILAISGHNVKDGDISVSPALVKVSVTQYTYKNNLGDTAHALGTVGSSLVDPASSLRVCYLRGRSPEAAALLHVPTNQIVVSTRLFEDGDGFVVTVVDDSSLGSMQCNEAGIYDVLVAPHRYLLATGRGVVQVTPNGDSSSGDPTFERKLVLAECIDALIPRAQFIPTSRDSFSEALAISHASVTAFYSPGVDLDFEEIKDISGNSLGQFMDASGLLPVNSSYRLVDCTYGIEVVGDYLFLVVGVSEVTGLSHHFLVAFDGSAEMFSIRYTFPLEVSGPCLDGSHFLNECDLGGMQAINLTGLSYASDASSVLYVYGNVFLISNSKGSSFGGYWYGDSYITFFASDCCGGAFSFVTADNVLYAGHSMLSSGYPYAIFTESSSFKSVLFDCGFSLVVTAALGGSGVSVVSKHDHSVLELLREFAEIAKSDSSSNCSVETVTWSGSRSSAVTRAYVDWPSALPHSLFLQHAAEYGIRVEYSPSDSYEIDAVRVDVQVSRPDIFEIKKYVSMDPIVGKGVYEIEIRDLASDDREPASPGDGLVPSSLSLSVSAKGSFCPNIDIVHQRIALYSGCAPGLSLQLDADLSRTVDQGCEDTDGISCWFHDNEMNLVFQVYDTVSNTSERYIGKYTFEVIGSGPSADQIELFAEDEISLFNGGKSSIVTTNGENGLIDSEAGAIQWSCLSGSPCYRVLPKFPNSAEMFFLVRVKSDSTEQNSYCAFETSFMMRVHGFNLDFVMTFTTTLGTAVLLVIVVMLFYFRHYLKERALEEEEIDSEDELSGDIKKRRRSSVYTSVMSYWNMLKR